MGETTRDGSWIGKDQADEMRDDLRRVGFDERGFGVVVSSERALIAHCQTMGAVIHETRDKVNGIETKVGEMHAIIMSSNGKGKGPAGSKGGNGGNGVAEASLFRGMFSVKGPREFVFVTVFLILAMAVIFLLVHNGSLKKELTNEHGRVARAAQVEIQRD